ncbi:uncharacterized protein [Eulemur rufifrons]|uniref:uncharacterized protein n=1 Tax=Eulemur rufifrons TaxID=859984 RepID=UPI00374308C5
MALHLPVDAVDEILEFMNYLKETPVVGAGEAVYPGASWASHYRRGCVGDHHESPARKSELVAPFPLVRGLSQLPGDEWDWSQHGVPPGRRTGPPADTELKLPGDEWDWSQHGVPPGRRTGPPADTELKLPGDEWDWSQHGVPPGRRTGPPADTELKLPGDEWDWSQHGVPPGRRTGPPADTELKLPGDEWDWSQHGVPPGRRTGPPADTELKLPGDEWDWSQHGVPPGRRTGPPADTELKLPGDEWDWSQHGVPPGRRTGPPADTELKLPGDEWDWSQHGVPPGRRTGPPADTELKLPGDEWDWSQHGVPPGRRTGPPADTELKLPGDEWDWSQHGVPPGRRTGPPADTELKLPGDEWDWSQHGVPPGRRTGPPADTELKVPALSALWEKMPGMSSCGACDPDFDRSKKTLGKKLPDQPDADTPITCQLRSAQVPTSALPMPLREVRGAMQVTDDGSVQPGQPVLYYQPFSTTDLLNWKHHTLPYSEKPQALIDLLESIFQTHRPTWEDCRQLLLTLFNKEERCRIVAGTRRWLQDQAPAGTLDVEQWAQRAAPETNPDWDFNSEWTRDTRKKLEESPSEFYERLCEANQVYTPFDPEAAENQRTVNAACVGRSYTDIRWKCQKLDGFAGMNITQLMEVAQKVYVNRDRTTQREKDQKMKQKAALLAAALGRPDPAKRSGPPREGGPRRRGTLKPDQCPYCKEFGHWKHECPNKRNHPPPNRNLPRGFQQDSKTQDLIGLTGVDSE